MRSRGISCFYSVKQRCRFTLCGNCFRSCVMIIKILYILRVFNFCFLASLANRRQAADIPKLSYDYIALNSLNRLTYNKNRQRNTMKNILFKFKLFQIYFIYFLNPSLEWASRYGGSCGYIE